MASKLRRAPLFGLDNPLRIPSLPKYSSPPSAPAATSGYKFPKSSPQPQPAAPSAGSSNETSYNRNTNRSSGSNYSPKPLSTTNKTISLNKTVIVSSSVATTKSSSNVGGSNHHTTTSSNSVTKNKPVTVTSTNKSKPVTSSNSNGSKSFFQSVTSASRGNQERSSGGSTLSAVAQLKLSSRPRSVMEVGVAYSPSQRPPNTVTGASPDRGRGSPKTSLHVDFAAPGEMKERKEKYLTAKYGAHQMALIRKRLSVEMWMFDQLQLLYPPKADGNSDEKEVDLDELLDLEDDTARRTFLRQHLSDCALPNAVVQKFIDELMDRAKML